MSMYWFSNVKYRYPVNGSALDKTYAQQWKAKRQKEIKNTGLEMHDVKGLIIGSSFYKTYVQSSKIKK